MVANIRGYTPNYNFKLVNFDTPRWHTLEYANWQQLDNMFSQLGTPPIRGEWLNSTMYVVGDRVFEAESGDLYRCLVSHTSAALGSFDEDRAANPDYWTVQVLGVPLYCGQWQQNTVYALGDIVVYGEYSYHLCTTSHTSTIDFLVDAPNWTLVFDATAAVESVEEDAIAADEDAAAAEESRIAAEQAASLASSAQSAFRWGFDSTPAMADPGIGKFRVNNVNPIGITQLALSAMSADFGNPNLSSWIVTWDDSTTASARGTIYLRRIDAPENFFIFTVNGPVQDFGTWLQISVQVVAFDGAVFEGSAVAIAFVRTGNTGGSGGGTGDLISTNNLSDVASASESAENLGLGVTDTPTFVQVRISPPTLDDHAATKKFSADGDVGVTSAYIAADAAITAAYQAADTAINSSKAPIDSPTFTTAANAPTPPLNDNDTSIATTAYVIGQASATATAPVMNGGPATGGVATRWSREDHKHPVDTSRAPLASPMFTGDPRLDPSVILGAGDSSNKIAHTAFVQTALERASAAEFRDNSQPNKLLTPGAVWTAAAPVIVTPVGTAYTPNMSLGFDFSITLASASNTLSNPTNGKAGQKGLIYILQGAGSSQLISSWGNLYLFPAGIKPLLSTPANSVDVISYVFNGTSYFCTFVADFK